MRQGGLQLLQAYLPIPEKRVEVHIYLIFIFIQQEEKELNKSHEGKSHFDLRTLEGLTDIVRSLTIGVSVKECSQQLNKNGTISGEATKSPR